MLQRRQIEAAIQSMEESTQHAAYCDAEIIAEAVGDHVDPSEVALAVLLRAYHVSPIGEKAIIGDLLASHVDALIFGIVGGENF